MHLVRMCHRETPGDLHETLREQAQRRRRNLAQQAVDDLSRVPELEARRKREMTIERLRRSPFTLSENALDPAEVIREDRDR